MKIIYTDSNKVEQGYLSDCSLDMEVGMFDKSSNDFEILVDYHNWDSSLNVGSIIYCEGTEYGGVITSIESDTGNEQVTLYGHCPRKLLSQVVISPESRTTPYYVFSGEANEAIGVFIKSRETFFSYDGVKTRYVNVASPLTSIFEISKEVTDFVLDHKVRYEDTFYALENMLEKIGAKLKFEWKQGKIELRVVPIIDFSDELKLNNTYGIEFIAKKRTGAPNHLIVLGSGELENRLVINIFKSDDGEYIELSEIGTDKSPPRNVISDVYDFKNNDGTAEMKEKGIARLKSLQKEDTLDMSVDELEADIGDIVGGSEKITGIEMKKPITRVILKSSISKNSSTDVTEYKVGD